MTLLWTGPLIRTGFIFDTGRGFIMFHFRMCGILKDDEDQRALEVLYKNGKLLKRGS